MSGEIPRTVAGGILHVICRNKRSRLPSLVEETFALNIHLASNVPSTWHSVSYFLKMRFWIFVYSKNP
jgi:hypothetical protein